ncbi:MAG TPA: outer membrane beta-barrel protein [Vicinamibacterales bacterium]|nr:outer membrane beta-barrel protein [Vicinamibacterales bacterium]
MRRVIFPAALLLAFALAAPAAAQTSSARVWIGVNGGIQPTVNRFTSEFDIQAFTESGPVSVKYPGRSSAGLFDASLGLRLWKQLGVGVAVTATSISQSASIDAKIPHPFFLDQFREVTGSISAPRSETAAHIQVLYTLPMPDTSKLRVILSAGPSVIAIDQSLVTDVQYAQTYPYDTATFSGATTQHATKTAVGFNVGGDAAWMFTHAIGVGGMVRFARANATLNAGTAVKNVTVHAGGVQVGAGLRLVF